MRRIQARSLFLASAFLSGGPLAAQTPLHTIEGLAQQDRLGNAVCGLGDLDGDGRPDFAVAAFREDAPGLDTGRVRVFSGLSGSLLFDAVGASGSGKDSFGYSICNAGDVNADGLDDLLVGATQSSAGGNPPGYAQVLSGADGALLLHVAGDDLGDEFGWAVAGLGDVDQDGHADFAVAARDDDDGGNDAGSVRVVSGATGAALYTLYGAADDDWFGWSIAAAGDVDQDGVTDLVVGIPGADPNGMSAAGAVRVFSGVNGAERFAFFGAAPHDNLGMSVAGAGHVDGDDRADVIVGAPQEDPGGMSSAGVARVLSGATGLPLHVFPGAAAGDTCGDAVTGIGDVDLDGYDDLAVASPWADPAGPFSGSVRVFSGADGALLATFDGQQTEESFGSALARVQDLNGDGYPDLLVGSQFADVNGTNSGVAQAFSGYDCPAPQPFCLANVNSAGAGAFMGWLETPSLVAQDFELRVAGAVPNQPGLFYYGPDETQQPFGDGWRCVGGQVFRLPVLVADAAGAAGLALADFSPPPPAGAITPGAVWRFQYWYRDPFFPAGSGFNLSDGLLVEFCP